MFAVIEASGRQYLVKTGEALKIEKMAEKVGEKVIFGKVLLTANDDGGAVKIGTPYIEGAVIEATIELQGRSKKVRVEKFKRKIRYHKVYGHRQSFSKIKIK
jgi:large subunit ribosomal protein L21